MWNAWVLLTHCFRRSAPYAMRLRLLCQMRRCFSAPYAMFLMLIFQMSGCYLRTAFGAVLRTLCSICLYVKCVGVTYALLFTLCSLCFYVKCMGASYALLLAQCSLRYVPYACLLNLYFTWVGATYALLLAQYSLRYAPYDCTSNAWVLQCSLNYVPYAYNSNEWVLLMHCFWRSAPYAMLLMHVGQMHGNCLRTALAQCTLRSVFYVCLLNLYLKWGGATYAMLFAQYSLRYAPYDCAPYALFLKFLCQMRGCYLRTAFCLVLLTLCSLCLYIKCVDAFYALPLAHCSLRYVSYVCRL